MKLTMRFLRTALAGFFLMLVAAASQGADIHKGRQLFATHCAVCHGQNGRSVIPGAPNFDRGEGLLRPDFTLLASIRAGKNAMPAFQGILMDRNIMDVIAYLRTLH